MKLRMGLVIALTLAFGATSGCVIPHHTIPKGRYLSRSGEESLTVSDELIRFHIRRLGAEEFLDITCGYTVVRDGALFPLVHSDGDALELDANFEWHWDGARVIQKERNNHQERNIFLRQP
jgi:hypothetical protein